MKIKEFNVSAPWGHIALKTWGDINNPTIVCLHGIQDNAASFDTIIPLLPNNFCYVCFDLPGHGKSSNFPENLPCYTLNYLLAIKLIFDYYNKDKYIILGHSFGGQIGFNYTQIYPENVSRIIMIDSVTINTYFRMEKEKLTKAIPTYTYEEALQKVQVQRLNGTISRKAAQLMLHRNVKPVDGNKYVFTIDQRMKNLLIPIHDVRYQQELFKVCPVECPVLIVIAKQSTVQEEFKPMLDFYKNYGNIKVVALDGYHDLHNGNPRGVAAFIGNFLLDFNNKL